MDERHFPVDGRLAVLEEQDAFVVVQQGNPEDWLARFEKVPGFPAREWAENMVRVYNRRVDPSSDDLVSTPGTQPVSYHPDDTG